MAALSEWLQIMLGEIARKREDLERARDEDSKRIVEKTGDGGTQRPDAASTTRIDVI